MAHSLAEVKDDLKQFLVWTNHMNPPHNRVIFEEYFYKKSVDIFGEGRLYPDRWTNTAYNKIYLPILWTNYYISKNYGQDDMSELQEFLDGLDKSKEYFTVVQWDDGILQNTDGLDLKVFASGGVGDVCIPLLCQPPPLNTVGINVGNARQILASFVGSIHGRHPVREKMKETLNGWAYMSETTDYPHFLTTMRDSIFALCPRGYGKTSFRICEALQQGAIPIYIYDDPWLPYGDPTMFDQIGIRCHIRNVAKLPSIVNELTVADIALMQQRGAEAYKEYYTYEGCYNWISSRV